MSVPDDLRKGVFDRVAEVADPAARAALLDEDCAGDPALRERVEALLRAHDAAGSFLDPPPVPTVPADRTTAHHPAAADPGAAGEVVGGRYALAEVIGEGGMGVVWAAEQTDPVRRRVAVKLIRVGMDSKQVLARFEAERQALALMDHPNIARVLDAGSAADGRPYFVMELVGGVPITRYCDDRGVSLRGRLALFADVSRAVQHAHQKGVIHRDIKPSNILVAEVDGRPVVKVIDFGVAKAAGARLTEETVVTGSGMVVGTPQYMSPEQARLDNPDVDTRSDVFALGVVLYELLTATTPLTRERVRGAALLDVLRLVREEEPPRPSARVAQLRDADRGPRDRAPEAAARGLVPHAAFRVAQLRELDWVVMRCLEKDRDRRYDSAAAVAADVERYLAGEPVLAVPPSRAYRVRKLLRRHRGPVAAAALVFLALVGGAVGTTVGLFRARDEAAQATRDRDRATAARDRAADVLDSMTSEAAGGSLLRQAAVTPQQREFLTAALRYYRELLAEEGGDEATRGRVAAAAFRIGLIEFRLRRRPEAEAMFRQARDLDARLAADFPANLKYRHDLALCHNNLGLILYYLARPAEAEAEFRAALERYAALVEEAPDDPTHRHAHAQTHVNLGLSLDSAGKQAEAAAAFRAAVVGFRDAAARAPDRWEYRLDLGKAHLNLGTNLHEVDRLDESAAEYRAAIGVLDVVAADAPGDPEPQRERAKARRGLGSVLAAGGQPAEAQAEFDAVLPVLRRLAADFPAAPEYRHELARTHTVLGGLRGRPGSADAAEEHRRAARDLYQRLAAEFPGGIEYRPDLAEARNKLGILLTDRGKYAEADAELRAAQEGFKGLADEFPAVVAYRVGLGGAYCNRGRLGQIARWPDADVLAACHQAVVVLAPVVRAEPGHGPARAFLFNSLYGRAEALGRSGRHAEAVADWEAALPLAAPQRRAYPTVGLMLSRVRAGQIEPALATAEELAGAAAGDVVYWCAAAYALAHARTKDDRHAARAVELLRRTIDLKFKNAAYAGKDPDFDTLRDRDDFRKALRDLEAP